MNVENTTVTPELHLKHLLAKFLLFGLCLLMLACGSQNSRKNALSQLGLPDQPYVQSEFNSYLLSFQEEANARGSQIDISNITILFSDLLDSSELGNCYPDDQFIEIDREKWQNKGQFDREQIVFHELAHCLLAIKEHRSETFQYNGIEVNVSIMSKNASSNYNKSSREYYLDELFDSSQSANLTATYIKNKNFIIKKFDFSVLISLGKYASPKLNFLDSTGLLQSPNLSKCSIISILKDDNTRIQNIDEILVMSSEFRFEFLQVGEFTINFDCDGDSYKELFIVK